MIIQLKLPSELSETIEGLDEVLKFETHISKKWINVDIEYMLVDVNKVAEIVSELLKTVLEEKERVGTRVNDIPFMVTKDNEGNLKTILKKLMV
ncbi:hypothetical protein [Staphylococcus pseudoxylosus]|uniref:hypothetical protein n=1 Tax=Staphylococcus pseudoxylosus TaxID=2282419 RepID=UPI002DBBC1B6|nr:hypothetical protein [Staphylococcus pseudoxylosus]MEB6038211.1 hypothetical protein [Staphylococcus pseudoxylosus]